MKHVVKMSAIFATSCVPRSALILLPGIVLLLRPGAALGDQVVDYLRDVRPILADYCFQCHGPDGGARQAGLRLDQRAAALAQLESQHVAIRPRNASDSELVRRIETPDSHDVMPPLETKRRLTAAQKLLLRTWIEQGATYAEHWAWQSPIRPDFPAVVDSAWVRNGIDPFVLSKLESANLHPAPQADLTTLVRRVSLDLTGLPPTVDEVDAFLNDSSPNAYERLVDRLLASPHFGEKMAQDWLDLARFGDSSGYQDDGDRPNFPYRDYVIAAFNSNMPFDQVYDREPRGRSAPRCDDHAKGRIGLQSPSPTQRGGWLRSRRIPGRLYG